jgi:dienelactone hydrolase
MRQQLIDGYATRAADAWQRDYSSVEALVQSVQPNRERWRELLNPPVMKKTGPLTKRVHEPVADIHGEWVTQPLGDLKAEGILVLPAGASPESPVPLVIAQHGIGSTPESPFGPPEAAYHSYGRELVKAGFAVLAPFNLRSIPSRNRVERLTRLAGTTLPGLEFTRLQHLLDAVLEDPRVDGKRVGMWGVSLGGMATMFFTPLEPRIKVSVVSAWFNHRLAKMAVPDPDYTSFLDTAEEHAFFSGWLTEFADHDVVSLICPRPILVDHGKKDRIADWHDLEKEFTAGRAHYEKLGMPERAQLHLHDGGHEASAEVGVAFMRKWLMER